MDNKLSLAIKSSLLAGKEILEVYNSKDFDIKIKSDNSPLTLADQRAHKVIVDGLKDTKIPILSEEGRSIPYKERANWKLYWLVDPLDGTKEFIKKNGEFTVNIALIKNGIPIAGVVYAPYLNDLYFSSELTGAYKISGVETDTQNLSLDDLILRGEKLPGKAKSNKYTIVGSRSHMNEETEEIIEKLKSTHGDVEFISKGSSLKICMVAEGMADIYPRFGPTMEWDTAAGHAIALGTGCAFTLTDEITPVKYNKKELLNPWFIVKK